mmetsp:Transcript_44672/g.95169  ORF Transcript_44672/g.95169 Transcript_44672/m.95169 type:complete len:202 (+) Transcript_44672:345-950(+)
MRDGGSMGGAVGGASTWGAGKATALLSGMLAPPLRPPRRRRPRLAGTSAKSLTSGLATTSMPVNFCLGEDASLACSAQASLSTADLHSNKVWKAPWLALASCRGDCTGETSGDSSGAGSAGEAPSRGYAVGSIGESSISGSACTGRTGPEIAASILSGQVWKALGLTSLPIYSSQSSMKVFFTPTRKPQADGIMFVFATSE